jgi:hypothetical protein
VPYSPAATSNPETWAIAARDIIYVCHECYTVIDDWPCPCLTEGIQCHMDFVPAPRTAVALSLAEMNGYLSPAIKQLAEAMAFKLGASVNLILADLMNPEPIDILKNHETTELETEPETEYVVFEAGI